MSDSANKYIPGLGKQFYVSPSHVAEEGGAEKYIPGLGKQFKIPSDSIDAKGGAEKYIPGLGRQFSIKTSDVEGGIVISAKEGVSGATVEVTVTTTGGIEPIVLKYASGGQVDSYFADGTNGTVIQGGKFTVSANGKYTLYAKDAIGMSTTRVINITKVDIPIVLNATEGAGGATVEVTVTATGGNGALTLKQASGEQVASYFDTAGTVITGNKFTVSANGKYTVYANDTTKSVVKVIDVKGVVSE